ncbi:hypothetical protein B14911_21788 [Bacillus sp. NRRL B-14911]|nr:hypothetical protein B14911_21788 [Bacillus sp. NRRL B-14911]
MYREEILPGQKWRELGGNATCK